MACQTEEVEAVSEEEQCNEVTAQDIAAFMDNQTILVEKLAL
jgi:hypothetical protein